MEFIQIPFSIYYVLTHFVPNIDFTFYSLDESLIAELIIFILFTRKTFYNSVSLT